MKKTINCDRCDETGKIRVSHSGHEKPGEDSIFSTLIEFATLSDFHYTQTCPQCAGRGRIVVDD